MLDLLRINSGPGSFIAWNRMMWVTCAIFAGLPSVALFREALRAPSTTTTPGVAWTILIILAYFAIATALSAARATRAVRAPNWLVGASFAATFALVAVGLYMVLTAAAEFGGVGWVLVATMLMLALHAANLAMAWLCAHLGAMTSSR